MPKLRQVARGWVECAEPDQSRRVIPAGDRCVLRIGCGQDGAWAYAFAPGDDDAILVPTAIAADASPIDVAGICGDAAILMSYDSVLRVAWPALDAPAESTIADGLTFAQYGDACDGIAFAPVAADGTHASMELFAYDAATVDLVARGAGLGAVFLGAGAGKRAIIAEPRGDRVLVRSYVLSDGPS
jgi:hypothetical protein